MLAMPKIIPAKKVGWKISSKRVGVPKDNKYPSTDFVSDFDGDYDNFDFYGFTVQNATLKFMGLRRSKAEIKSGKMEIRDANKNIVKKDIPVRYTVSNYYTPQNPLFTGNFIGQGGFGIKQDVTLGDGQELEIVIACKKSETNDYYFFTASSDVYKMFPANIDRFPQKLPCYLKIDFSGDKLNDTIYLLVKDDVNKDLAITLISKVEFDKPTA